MNLPKNHCTESKSFCSKHSHKFLSIYRDVIYIKMYCTYSMLLLIAELENTGNIHTEPRDEAPKILTR